METLLFEKLLSRTAKECNYLHLLNSKYNRKQVQYYIKTRIQYNYSISILSILMDNQIIPYHCQYNNNTNFLSFIDSLNVVIYLILYKDFIHFLKENHILVSFFHNLINSQSNLYQKLNTVSIKNFNEQIKLIRRYHLNFFDVICDGFTWRATTQGYVFCLNLDKKYKNKIFILLFNINYDN